MLAALWLPSIPAQKSDHPLHAGGVISAHTRYAHPRLSIHWSNLSPARSNVQFQSVTDKFSPNDTVLPLSKASDLTESALSSACLLHTASTSITSSSSSLRRRRLMEITEDAEENGTKDEDPKPVPPPQSEARRTPRSVKSEATLVPSPIEPPLEPELPPTSPESEKASVDLMPPPSRASSRATISRDRKSVV